MTGTETSVIEFSVYTLSSVLYNIGKHPFERIYAMYTKSDLIRHIRALGIQPTDTVMVHTSLKSIGIIDPEDKTTAEIYIDALREVLCEGLLLIPAHTWATVREDGQEFNVRTSLPCIGAVPTAAVKLAAEGYDDGRRDCLRSLHPTHSVVAFGKRAEEYILGDIQAETPAPKGGCFGKLYEEHAKILLVGVNQGRNTFFHAVDEYLDIPNRLMDFPIHVTVRDYEGNVFPRTLTRHSHSMSDYFMNYESYLEDCGAVSFGRIGDALVRVCDAVKCTHAIARLWKNADHDLCEKNEVLDFEKLLK